MKTGNKGEWSELYAFFKVIADGKLYPGDANLHIRPSHYYPVIEIHRREQGLDKTYLLSGPNVVFNNQKAEEMVISRDQFEAEAGRLIQAIKMSSGAFSVPTAEGFLNFIGGTEIKASSTRKADITIKIHDSRTNLQPILGFSIKSKLGSPSTLLNASQPTNFIFKILGEPFNVSEVNFINNINSKQKIKDRISYIHNNGRSIVLKDFESKVFKNNLMLIDSSLPDILANALTLYNNLSLTTLSALANKLELDNPLSFDQSSGHKFYEHKLKRCLSEIALGMMPSLVWNGLYNGTEGYLIIREDGELVCYHIIERNLFEDYLLANTKFETASTSRHDFGTIYQIGEEQLIKLNLQIRFI